MSLKFDMFDLMNEFNFQILNFLIPRLIGELKTE